MSSCCICEFFQPFAAHTLSKQKDEQLAPVGRSRILGSVASLGHKVLEIPLWKKTGYLNENVMAKMHICPQFDLGAKVRISKVQEGIQRLLCCA